MKQRFPLLLGIALAAFFFTQQFASAAWYHIFKAAAVMPIQVEAIDAKGNGILIKKTIGSKDLVNLALGRPLHHAVDSKTEMLALQYDISNPAANKLIVYNSVTQTVVRTIANTASMPGGGTVQTDKANSEKEKGGGIAIVTFLATTTGAPSMNGIVQQSTVYGAAQGSWSPTENGPVFALKASALFGPLAVRITDSKTGITTLYDGIVVQGMFQTSGVAIKHHLWL